MRPRGRGSKRYLPHSALRENNPQLQLGVVRKGLSKSQNSPVPVENQAWLSQVIQLYYKALDGETEETR